ncbi:MAG TPA: response regulator [Opitutaceae bacterium]|nr:response regulator [Opitutaceae bacterium]
MTDSGKFILLAEDDAVVAELVMHGLATSDPPPRVVHVRDGVDTLDFLFARERYAHRAPGTPAVVLLDIKMPRLDGLEVLRQIKGDDRLRAIPVVMLTSSQDERDVRDCYQLGANAYIVKPVEFRRFMEVLREMNTFWMRINHPPSETTMMATVPHEGPAHPRDDTSLEH